MPLYFVNKWNGSGSRAYGKEKAPVDGAATPGG